MKVVLIIATMFLGTMTAQGQTALQLNGQTNSSESAIGSDPLSAPTSSLPSMSSPSPASQLGTASGSPTTTGSASGATGATSSASGRSTNVVAMCGLFDCIEMGQDSEILSRKQAIVRVTSLKSLVIGLLARAIFFEERTCTFPGQIRKIASPSSTS